MPKETYPQRKIKEKIAKKWNDDRGREYYWVKPVQDEVYHGEPYNSLYSPKGHERAEDLAKRRSKENSMRVEIYWTSGPYGKNNRHKLSNWRLYKVYENGTEIDQV